VRSNNLRLLLQRGGSRRLFIASIAASFIWVGIIVASGLVLARVIVAIIDKDSSALSLIAILAALWAFRAVFNSTFETWCSLQASSIKKQIRNEVTSNLDSYSHVPPSVITTLLVKGLNSLDIYLGRFLPQLFFSMVVPSVVIVTIFILDPLSALIAVLTLPLIPVFGALIGRYTADSVAKKWRSLGSLSSYFEDSLRGFITLKIFGVIAVTIGIRLVYDSIDFTSALAVLILAPEVYFPLRNAASLFHASADGSQALEQLKEVEKKKGASADSIDCDFSRVSAVSWSEWRLNIPGRESSVIEAHTAKSGELHFILGESGVGKSTFALNLLGITHEAEVIVNSGATQRLLTPELNSSWLKNLGWIPQLPQLAHGSLRDQFRLISPTASDEEIKRVLSLVGLEIEELHSGLETVLGGSGEGASTASGGQVRKIAVARALFSKPQLLIADEPTADLDSQSAGKVMKALRSYAAAGEIVICITHDLSIVETQDSRQSFVSKVPS